MTRFLLLAAASFLHTPATALPPANGGSVTQLFSYRLIDPVKFREGYRTHLGWHAAHHDRLAWYAWFVEAGPRRGLFIDGTAGASLAALDARPDLAGDGADFAATAAPYAQPVDIETWQLWQAPTTATPLEDRKPGAIVDAFLLEVPPAKAAMFERRVADLARERPAGTARLTWYRKLRGGGAPTYMILLSRETLADISSVGGPFPAMLASVYGASEDKLAPVLTAIASVSNETWSYEPRLSLFPGGTVSP